MTVTEINVEEMQEVTYLNEDSGTWGFYGCDDDMYETQHDAYAAYVRVK